MKKKALDQKKPRPRAKKADGESAVFAASTSRDRYIAERPHAIVKATAPFLSPRLRPPVKTPASSGPVWAS